MQRKTVDIDFPVALNTYNNKRLLLPTECYENVNLIKTETGDLRMHYNFEATTISDTSKLFYGIPFKTKKAKEQLIVFGTDTNGGFVGYMSKPETMVTKLLTELDVYLVPSFVEYKEKIYVFAGDVYTWDGEEWLEDEEFEAVTSYVACEFRERLFYTSAGVLFYTGVGLTAPNEDNFFYVGLVDEPITALIPKDYGIMLVKRDEIWDLVYPTAYIEDAYIRKRSNEVGASINTAHATHFDTTLLASNRGCHLVDPKGLTINPSRVVEVNPNIVRISDPIHDLYKDFYHRTVSGQIVFRKLKSETSGNYAWDMDDFEPGLTFGIEVDTNSNYNDYTGLKITSTNLHGWATVKLQKPTGQKWSSITALAWYEQPVDEDYIWVGVTDDPDQTYIRMPMTRKYDELGGTGGYFYTIAGDVPSRMRSSQEIYIRIYLRKILTGTGPFMHDLGVYSTPTEGALFFSGFYRDTFYLSGDTYSGERQVLAFRNGGWLKVTSDVDVYSIIDEVPWTENYSIVGFGEEQGVGGKILTIATPETLTGSVSLWGETGNLDFGAPDLPKKLRKIFICYKGGGTLTVYDENGNSFAHTLDTKSDFYTEEFAYQTDRSKFFRLKLTSTDASFSVRMPIRVEIKIFQPNEL